MTRSTRRRRRLSRIAILGATAFASRGLAAQECTTSVVRTAPSGIAGAYIRTVTVKPEGPIALPFVGARLNAFRRTTLAAVVQRQLLFEPGQRADTARIGESLRRIRDQRIYSDLTLTVTSCADTVDLTVATRDAWTLRPVARAVPPSTFSLGAEDRNVLGTARQISFTADETPRGHGGTAALTDPFLFGADVIGAVRLSDIAGSHVFRASVRHRERSVLDEWRTDVAFGRQTFNDVRASEHPLASVYAVADVGHRVGESTTEATVVYAGAQVDSGAVVVVRRQDTIPTIHSRRFVGIDLGLSRRTAVFDTVSWFIHDRGFLDVPVGFEEDLMLTPGYDKGQHQTAARYDGWIGQVWKPGSGHILTADASTSGYVGNVRANHIDRLAISEYNEAVRGFWGGRLMFEQLIELDPDLRTLTLASINADPSFSAVPVPFRLANRSAFGSIEREMHLMPFGRASMIDAGVFGAGSLRWDAPNTTTQSFGLLVTGVRLRVLSTNGLVNSTRIDLAYPVHANTPIKRRPLLSISLGSLFDVTRQRDMRRRQQ